MPTSHLIFMSERPEGKEVGEEAYWRPCKERPKSKGSRGLTVVVPMSKSWRAVFTLGEIRWMRLIDSTTLLC